MTVRNYTNTASQATTTGSIDATTTTVTLTNFTGYPAPPFAAAFDRGTATEEVVLVTGVAGSSVTMTRGYNGTTAKTHAASASFQHVAIALDFGEANQHVNTTTGVHGLTGAVVGTTDVQTLTNKTLTQPQVFAPNISGTTTAQGVNASNVAASGTLTVSGVSTLAGLNAGNTVVTGTLSTSSDASIGGALTATGALTANGGVTTTTVTGSGLVKGAGLESTAALALAQVAAPTGVAAKQTLWAQSDNGLYTRTGIAAVARVPVHFGSGTTYPTGALEGDTYRHTTLAGAQMRWSGSAWTQESVPQVADVAAATALKTAAIGAGCMFDGFRVFVSAVNAMFTYSNGAWRYTLSGAASGTSTSDGQFTVAHGGDRAPTSWLVTPARQASDGIQQVINLAAWDVSGATGLIIRVTRNDTPGFFQTFFQAYWTASW